MSYGCRIANGISITVMIASILLILSIMYRKDEPIGNNFLSKDCYVYVALPASSLSTHVELASSNEFGSLFRTKDCHFDSTHVLSSLKPSYGATGSG
jgi:hypothetical protein